MLLLMLLMWFWVWLQTLHQLNGDKLFLSDNIMVLFETDNLSVASPATVARSVSIFTYGMFNPFTAPACKTSRLKDALARLQTVYFPVL